MARRGVRCESGREYSVDVREGACECPDHEHRDAHCKHARAVEFVIGERPIPAWVNREAIENSLGEHIEESPVFETDESEPEPATVSVAKPSRAVMADSGMVASDPQELDAETETCDHPDCEHGQGKERPVLCWNHWEERQEARR